MTKATRLLVGAAVFSLALAACGGAADGSDGGGDGGADGEQTLKIGVTGLTTNAPLYYAEEQGWFDDEGLDVSIEVQGGAAAAVPSLASGEIQVGAGNLISIMQAVEQGIDLKALSGINVAPESADDTGHLTSAILVPEDSDIESPADLAGRTITVNALGGLGDLTIKAAVGNDNGDPDAVNYTELAFPDMLPAIEDGQVDAIWVVEPFVSQATASGLKVISYNFFETMPGLPLGVYFTTPDTAATYADELEVFQDVMDRATAHALENEEDIRSIVPTFTAVPEEAAEVMALPVFASTIPQERIEEMGQMAVDYGLIQELPDLGAIFEDAYAD